MSEQTPEDRDMAILDQAIQVVIEHFDYVHIFAGRYEGGDGFTYSANKGAGNWHARRSQIRDWTIYHDECVRMSARKNEDNAE